MGPGGRGWGAGPPALRQVSGAPRLPRRLSELWVRRSRGAVPRPHPPCACSLAFHPSPLRTHGPEKGLGRPARHPALNMQQQAAQGAREKTAGTSRQGWKVINSWRNTALHRAGRRQGKPGGLQPSYTNLENDPGHKSPCGLVPESGHSLATPNSFQVGEMLQRWRYSQAGRFRLQERGLARVQHVRGWRAVPRLPGRAAPSQGL